MIRRKTKKIHIPTRIQELLMSEDLEMVALGANCLFNYTKSTTLINRILEDFSCDTQYYDDAFSFLYGKLRSYSTYSYLKTYWTWTINKDSTIHIKSIQDQDSLWFTNTGYQYVSSGRNKVHKREIKYPYKVYTFEEVEEKQIEKNNFIKPINKNYEQKKFYKRSTWRKQAR